MTQPLYVNLMWHMHQPFYKDLVTERYILPWVRLHGTKDYYDMVKILEGYPNVRQTVNLVPSLLYQIQEYADGSAQDRFIDLTLLDPAEMSTADKVEVLTHFFYANHDTMIAPWPRYADLLKKRGEGDDPERLARVCRYFSDQDIIDLQVWFNLAWCDPMFMRDDPVIKDLVDRGRDYNADDKVARIERHRVILGMIIPEYRRAAERGQVELTTTPFFHPILPLLCDTEVARESLPHNPLPRRFMHPEDAEEQINRAVAFHTELFGAPPRGMWPSEGSVSEAMLPLVAQAGIKWIATDEGVLRESQRLGSSGGGDHFRPYLLQWDGHNLSVIFRDHRLSDRIGFVYSSWEPESAADDFIESLHQIRRDQEGGTRPALANVILDGENCWEYYPGDGHAFLHALYRRLNDDPNLICTTVSDYLEAHPASDHLPRLFAGSWINHDFEIWIGRDEDNTAWEYLQAARDALDEATNTAADEIDPKRLQLAWDELYISEGSDWCWWYGGQHAGMLEAFDELFRRHLMNIYELIERPVPEALHVPILRQVKEVAPTRPEVALIHPTIDGRVGSYFEWLSAARFEVAGGGGGAMHAGEQVIGRLFYGFDRSHLYLRLDWAHDMDSERFAELDFSVRFMAPSDGKFNFTVVPGGDCPLTHMVKGDDGWREVPFKGKLAADEIIGLSVPYQQLGWQGGDEVQLFIRVRDAGGDLERWPRQGYLAITLPGQDYEAQRWYV